MPVQNKLLLASNNPHKLTELRALLTPLVGVALLSPVDVGIDLDPEETGATYRENAAIKARAFHLASGLPTLADDSGLEVDALDGAPGLYSKRYGGLHGRAQLDHLLAQLHGVPEAERTARFRAVVVLSGLGEERAFEGVCEGRINFAPVSENGFGYDPLFFIPEQGGTMAQLEDGVKNVISHRARAVQAAMEVLKEVFAV